MYLVRRYQYCCLLLMLTVLFSRRETWTSGVRTRSSGSSCCKLAP